MQVGHESADDDTGHRGLVGSAGSSAASDSGTEDGHSEAASREDDEGSVSSTVPSEGTNATGTTGSIAAHRDRNNTATRGGGPGMDAATEEDHWQREAEEAWGIGRSIGGGGGGGGGRSREPFGGHGGRPRSNTIGSLPVGAKSRSRVPPSPRGGSRSR